MNRVEADEFIADTKRKAREILVDDGRHAPLVFLFPPDDVEAAPLLFHLGEAMSSDEGKEAASDAVRQMAARAAASGAVTIMEAWMSPAAVWEMWGVRPSEDPDRLEVLIVSWEFRVLGEAEKYQGHWYQFFHHEGEKIVLDESREIVGPHFGGRFSDLLP